jgi:hypothetical protein
MKNRFNFETLKVWQGVTLGLFAVALVVALAIAIPFSKDDNINKYSGVQRKVAQAAIDMEYDVAAREKIPHYYKFLKATVEGVHLKCSEESIRRNPAEYTTLNCRKRQYDPQRPSAYMVTVAEWTFFGIKFSEYTRSASGLGVYP